jgi:hypothetical protein
VATAQTTLRGRRDLLVGTGDERIVVRIRPGAPSPTAGAGLRADLCIDALGDANGVSARRFIGLWPEAGLLLAVDGTMENLRSGARDLVRTVVVQRRQLGRHAA